MCIENNFIAVILIILKLALIIIKAQTYYTKLITLPKIMIITMPLRLRATICHALRMLHYNHIQYLSNLRRTQMYLYVSFVIMLQRTSKYGIPIFC